MKPSYEPTKMWSGRFRSPLNATFESWQRSFPFDARLLPHEVAASKAHAQAIAAAGILTDAELKQMLEGLDAVGELDPASGFLNTTQLAAGLLTDAHEIRVWMRAQPLLEAARKKHARYHLGTNDPHLAKMCERFKGTVEAVLAQKPTFAELVLQNPQAEDIHHFVELALTKEIGDLALKLHTGRSRNEQIATDMRLFVREAIDTTTEGLKEWAQALLALAERAGEQTMPSYTHLQRAEPVLIAHWLLAYVSMIERDLTRLADARARMNLCPLGSGAIAGATLALDRHIAARALGFDSPTANSLDATSDRDFALEFTQALTVLGLHISRFAEELTLHATAEYGFLDLPEAFSTGSSAMPQKKNPDLTELIRGKSARLLGSSVTLATLIKGLPLAYNKDLQEGQEPVFDAADTIAGILSVLPAFTRALTFRPDRMQQAAETGYLNAMAAATYLSNKGVPFRKAHEIVGNAVRLGLESSRELQQLTLAELQPLSPAFAEDFYEAITLEATLDCHDVIGGTSRARVAEALESAKLRLAQLK